MARVMASSTSKKLKEISGLLKQNNWEKRISFLYKKEIMADCYFVIDEGEGRIKIPAHKFVLSARSKEFFNIFFLMEAGSNEIFVNGFSINILNTFLKFVYNITVTLDMSEVWDILKISRLYGVEHIIEKCIDFIGKINITDNNVFIVLNKAISFELPTVDLLCLDFIKSTTIQIFQNPHFLDMERTTLEKILRSHALPGTEIEIYRIVIKWIDNKLNVNNLPITSENRINCLGPQAIKDIRFRTMTISEFNECSEDANSILSKDEMLDIYRFIGSNCRRERVFSCCMSSNMIRFTLNTDVLVSGLSLLSRFKHPKNINYFRHDNVSYFIEDEHHNKIAENTAKIFDNGTDHIAYVYFKEKCLLRKCKNYIVHVHVNKEGLDLLDTVMLNDIPNLAPQCGGVEFTFSSLIFTSN